MQKENIIELNKGLIYKIAQKFYGIPLEDLFQAGSLGVWKAYQNYQNNGQTKFSTYAYDYIFGEMYELLRKERPLKINSKLLKLNKAIENARYSLAQKLGYIPNNLELAKFLEMDVKDIDRASLINQEVISFDNQSNDERSKYEEIKKEENISLEDKLFLEMAIATLPKDEQDIIKYRYYNDLTQSEVAKLLNMNQVKVSRYEKKGLAKMKSYSRV